MNLDLSALQDEIQGDGFLDAVREKRMPGSREISDQAIARYEEEFGELTPDYVENNIDSVLQKLIRTEQEIYAHHESEVYRYALVHFLQEYYQTGQASLASFGDQGETNVEFAEYANLQAVFEEIEDIYTGDEGFVDAFSEILPLLYPVMDSISVSAQQSRRKRAGTSLQTHLSRLLEAAGFELLSVQMAGNGHVYDIAARDADGQNPPATSIYISCLTTMRDRFRQSLSAPSAALDPDKDNKFIATASGKDLITASAAGDVTREKIQEITAEGFTLVVFEDVKNEKFPAEDGVISYTQFFAEKLPALIG